MRRRKDKELTCQIFILTPLAGPVPASRQKLALATLTDVAPLREKMNRWLAALLQLAILRMGQHIPSPPK